MQRLLIVAATPPQPKPLLGGNHRYLLQLAALLREIAVETGLEVHIASDEGENYAPLYEGIEAAGIARHRAPFCTKPGEATIALDELIRTLRPDIVHVNGHQAWLGPALTQSRELASVPRRVFTMHLPFTSLEATKIGLLDLIPGRWAARQLRTDREFARMFTDVFSVSQVYGKRAVERRIVAGSAIHVVPNGVDCQRVTPRAPHPAAGPLIVGALGELRFAKRIDRMLRAVAAINSSRSPEDQVELHLAGEGDLEDELKALCTELGQDHCVKFLGFQSDVPAFLGSLDILVMPSSFEAAPYSLLEAMAAGLPTVVTDPGDLPFMVRDQQDGLVVPEDREDLFEVALSRLVRDENMRTAMGLSARSRAVKTFSTDTWKRTMRTKIGAFLSA